MTVPVSYPVSYLQNALLAACGYAPDRHVASARLVWTPINGVSCPQEGNDKIKRSLDSVPIMRYFNLVAKQAPTVIDKAQLLAVQNPHSSDWLHAIPISLRGLRLDNEDKRVALGLRLCLELCQHHPYPFSAMVDA